MELRERERELFYGADIDCIARPNSNVCVYLRQESAGWLAHAVVKAAAGDCKFTEIRF
jgi:hypothetical protein